jgi:hypothetical protein
MFLWYFATANSHGFRIGGIRFNRQRFSARRFNRAHDFISLGRG